MQGVGQALLEAIHYTPEDGQLLTGSFMDYALPRADTVPPIRTLLGEVPASSHPHGIRPGGEGGTTPALGVLVNAVCHALKGLGVRHIEMPMTPERVWRAIGEAPTQPVTAPVQGPLRAGTARLWGISGTRASREHDFLGARASSPRGADGPPPSTRARCPRLHGTSDNPLIRGRGPPARGQSPSSAAQYNPLQKEPAPGPATPKRSSGRGGVGRGSGEQATSATMFPARQRSGHRCAHSQEACGPGALAIATGDRPHSTPRSRPNG